MKAIVPPPPGLQRHEFDPLPDHTQLPEREGEPGSKYRNPPAPDHTVLPDKDGTFVRNTLEPLQSHLLTESMCPWLRRRQPGGDFLIGEDCGIYWRLTVPVERGAKAPDWFVVLDVPRLLDGQLRRSYVMWQELIAPVLILEYVSGDGSEERDRTPFEGKFWVYERAIQAFYYGIFEVNAAKLEFFHLVNGRYELLPANERGRYPLAPLGVELGIWNGSYRDIPLSWLRCWDNQGNLLLTGDERADLLAARLRAAGIDPDQP